MRGFLFRSIEVSFMTERLLQVVAGVLDAHQVRGRTIAVALSGGMDSMVLLDLLDRLRSEFGMVLSAVHVNHGISRHAPDWAALCAAVCNARGIALRVERVSAMNEGSGLEAAARRLRYRAFGRIEAEFIALAHQIDDQAETFLLQLLRGAGAKGLASMPVVRDQDSGLPEKAGRGPVILRPLLQVRRREIEAYASARGLKWVEDESNTDCGFDRNYLRSQVLPLLEARFPGYRETLARTSRNLSDYAALAEELAQIDGPSADLTQVPVERLRQLSDARALNLLRRMFSLRDLPMPPRERLQEALRQCREAADDAQVHVVFGNHGLRCHRGRVDLVEERGRIPAAWNAAWDGRQDLLLPGGLGWLRGRSENGEGIASRHFEVEPAVVRSRGGGERIRPAQNRPVRSLKNLLQERAVPPWERARMPLVFFGEKLAWVPGIGVAQEFRAEPGEQGIVPEWERG